MEVTEKIAALRSLMDEYKMDAYIVPTADYHQSEYVGEHFMARAFLTGFTGSAGTVVVTKTKSCLWTDGRYFLQAAAQLEGSGIALMKSGEEGVPEIPQFLENELGEGAVIGFDGRTVGIRQGKEYEEIARKKGGRIIYQEDLVDKIWENRPSLPQSPAFALDLCYAGEDVASKLKRIREKMGEYQASALLLTGLDDIGWMLNIRGRDVEYFPLLLSYAVVTMEEVELYVDAQKLDSFVKKRLEDNCIQVCNYDLIYERMKKFTKEDRIWLDETQVNYALSRNLAPHVPVVIGENPLILMKAVKNDVEVENIRMAHIKDGVAHTKFMYWLKQNVGKIQITEMSASKKLEELRAEQGDFISPSFGPISAYKEHAAIVHYSSTPETNVELSPKGLFLTDTGGNYFQGSTDITRTVALGPITEEERTHFTTVVASMLNLADAVFLHGATGMNLDYAAREPFWRQHLNYNHGTGHGVGYLGNIHEPPQRFMWKPPADGNVAPALEKNMVITDEPGIYIEGSHGIRIENELLVCEDEKNEYGRFMRFEHLTFVPIDLDALKPELLTERELGLLNAYHKQVYEKIAPYLDEEERKWLKRYTREITA